MKRLIATKSELPETEEVHGGSLIWKIFIFLVVLNISLGLWALFFWVY